MKKIAILVAITVFLFIIMAFLLDGFGITAELADSLPEIPKEDIEYIEVFIYDSGKSKIVGEDFDNLLLYLEKAEPTRIESISDSVYSKDYRGINIKTANESYRYFVYVENGKTLLEIPYYGVYNVDAELFALLDSCLK